jgi:hypothetical protein
MPRLSPLIWSRTVIYLVKSRRYEAPEMPTYFSYHVISSLLGPNVVFAFFFNCIECLVEWLDNLWHKGSARKHTGLSERTVLSLNTHVEAEERCVTDNSA